MVFNIPSPSLSKLNFIYGINKTWKQNKSEKYLKKMVFQTDDLIKLKKIFFSNVF